MSGSASTKALAVMIFGMSACCSFRRPAETPFSYGETAAVNGGHEYTFGVPPSRSPSSLFRAYEPLLELVSKNAPFSLKFQTSINGERYRSRLRARSLDFALASPDVAIAAEDWGYRIIAKAASRDRLQGLLVVRADSKIRRPRQLIGQRICFASTGDLAGEMMVKLRLHAFGVRAPRDFDAFYTGSGEACAINVAFGLAAAGGIPRDVWESLRQNRQAAAGKLRSIARTEYLPGTAMLARADLPGSDMEYVQQTFLKISSSGVARGALQTAGISGFERTSSGSYDEVWEFLNNYQRAFGTGEVSR